MKQNGYVGAGIDVIEHNGKRYVIDGHHRLAAAKRTNTNVNINVVTDIKKQNGSGFLINNTKGTLR